MNTKRLYVLLIGTLGLCVILLLVGVYGTNALLKNQAKQLDKSRLESVVLAEKQQQVVKQRANIIKYQDLAAVAKQIVPQDKDQARTVREIANIASRNGVKLSSIIFPSSTLGNTKSGNASLSQLKPVKDIPGVYSLEITIQSDVDSPTPYRNFLSLLEDLESNRRTALVSGITLQPDTKDPGKLSFTLTLSEYLKP